MATQPLFDYLASHTAQECAQRLLGCELVRTLPSGILRARIVETEAYHATDAASHSYRGQTPRNSVMFGPSGRLYVYFTYGMHYCTNIVTGSEGDGSAVLLRALEPLDSIDIMSHNRAGKQGIELTNGPAKLAQALDITKHLNGHNLNTQPLQLIERPPLPARHVITATRIGIRYNTDAPLRFYIADNDYVSRVI